MKILFVIAFFELCVVGVFAQSSRVTLDVFQIDKKVIKDGKLVYFNSEGDTTIHFMFGLSKNVESSPNLMVKLQMVLENNGVEIPVSDDILIDNSFFSMDFNRRTDGLERTFTLPSNQKEGTLKLKCQYDFNFPSHWSAWAYHSRSYQTEKYQPPLPPSGIFGPDRICDEGIYTITNSGVITLENANGIATLTELANNQWKVTRTGSSSGEVKIVSTIGTKQYTKSVMVGIRKPKFKHYYPDQLDYGTTYTFVLESDRENDILEIEKLGIPQIIFTRVNNDTFTIKTPPKSNSNDPVAPVYIFSIKARVLDDQCGNSEYLIRDFQIGSLN